MNLFFIKQWEANKHLLEDYFQATEQREYATYAQIIHKLFSLCITKYNEISSFNLNKLKTEYNLDSGGTVEFIIPSDEDSGVGIKTSVCYGSCSDCDTLKGIHCYEKGLPTKEQVRDYMTLSLHLVQKIEYVKI